MGSLVPQDAEHRQALDFFAAGQGGQLNEDREGHGLAAVRESKRGAQEELRLGGEGEGRPVRALFEPIQGGGVLAVLEDLSLLAQAEKRAAWQEVARRMAHEVKNPLTPIQLTAQRLLRRTREGRLDLEAVKEGAETILAEVSSLSRLVDSFSRFARLPVPQFSPCDPADLLRQVATPATSPWTPAAGSAWCCRRL